MSGAAQTFSESKWKFVLLYAIAFSSVLPFARLFQSESINDEGIVCLGAVRLLLGDAVYTDFTTHFSPGVYYFAAFLYLILGPSIEATRLGMALITGGLGVLIYLIGARILGDRSALIPYLMFLGAGVTQWPILSYHWLGSLSYLFGVWALLRWLELPSVTRALLVGAALGLSFWSLQSAAAALVVLSLFVAVWKRRLFTIRHLAATVFALIISSLLLWGHAVSGSSVQEIWTQNVLWIVDHNAQAGRSTFDLANLTTRWGDFAQGLRSAPMGLGTVMWVLHSLSYLLMWTVNYGLFYPAFVLAAVFWFYHRSQEPVTLILLAQGVLILVWQSRQTMLYLNFLTPLFLVLLVWSFMQFPSGRFRLREILVAAFLGIYLTAYIFQCAEGSKFRWPIYTSRGTLYGDHQAMAEAWKHTFWQASRLTPPGTEAFCFPYSMGFYYLSGVRPVGRFLVLVPILGPDHEFPAFIEELNDLEVPFIYHTPWSEQTLQAVPTMDKERFFESAKVYQDAILEHYEFLETLPAGQQLFRRKGEKEAHEEEP